MPKTEPKLLNSGKEFDHIGHVWQVLLYVKTEDLEGYLCQYKDNATSTKYGSVYFFERTHRSIAHAEKGGRICADKIRGNNGINSSEEE